MRWMRWEVVRLWIRRSEEPPPEMRISGWEGGTQMADTNLDSGMLPVSLMASADEAEVAAH